MRCQHEVALEAEELSSAVEAGACYVVASRE